MDLKYLDIAIGAIFIYLLLSLFASTIVEFIATWFSFRANTLEKAIKLMLNDFDKKKITLQAEQEGKEKIGFLSKCFYECSVIRYLGFTNLFGRYQKPSYIMPRNFSKSLIDIILNKSTEVTIGNIKAGLEKLRTDFPSSTDSVEYIGTLLRDAGNDIEKFKEELEKWFNDTMDRANGWYKRTAQYWLLGIGLTIAILFNADTLHILKYLSDDPKKREEMVNVAKVYMQKYEIEKNIDGKKDSSTIKKAEDLLNTATKQQKDIIMLNDGALGWRNGLRNAISKIPDTKITTIINKGIGFLLTALAISLGATFWFDLLKKLINIRGTGPNPDEKKKKSTT